MTNGEELQAELERLRAENAALKARSSTGVSMKVSEKGAVSVYGLGRFPVTLYQEQWLKLLDLGEDIRTLIREYESRLKKRGLRQRSGRAVFALPRRLWPGVSQLDSMW